MTKVKKDLGTILKFFSFFLFYSETHFAYSLIQETKHLIVDPEILADQVTPPPPTQFVDWNDWEAWVPSPDLLDAFPYYRMGYDNDGLVAYVIDFGKWDFRHWPEERMDEFWQYSEQLIRFQQRDFKASGGQGLVGIIDFDGFELKHHASPGAIKMALSAFVSLNRLHVRITYGFYLNVNYAAETFLNLSRPFIGGVLDKYEGYGTRVEKWKPLILRKFPADQVPPKYGGTNKEWKPLPLIR